MNAKTCLIAVWVGAGVSVVFMLGFLAGRGSVPKESAPVAQGKNAPDATTKAKQPLDGLDLLNHGTGRDWREAREIMKVSLVGAFLKDKHPRLRREPDLWGGSEERAEIAYKQLHEMANTLERNATWFLDQDENADKPVLKMLGELTLEYYAGRGGVGPSGDRPLTLAEYMKPVKPKPQPAD